MTTIEEQLDLRRTQTVDVVIDGIRVDQLQAAKDRADACAHMAQQEGARASVETGSRHYLAAIELCQKQIDLLERAYRAQTEFQKLAATVEQGDRLW